MRIVSYIDPERSFLPATGIGRHMNNMLLGLAAQPGYEVSTLCAGGFVGRDGRLPETTPLCRLPVKRIPLPIQMLERVWKLLGAPATDRWVGAADWVYLPEECLFPVRRTPVAITVHDVHAFETALPWSNTPVHRSKRRRWSHWFAPALQRATRILAVSAFTRRRLIELFGIEPSRISVVGNGVEEGFFRIGAMAPEQLTRVTPFPYALVIGGLTARKGGEHVLAVAGELQRARSPLQILVAGRSEPRLAALATHHHNIVQLGAVNDSELPAILRCAVAMLVLSEYEGFGIPAVEAMAAGVPVIAANRAALPETVGDGGLIVEPDDALTIVDTLRQIERSPRALQATIATGRTRAMQFRWSRCVHNLIAALN